MYFSMIFISLIGDFDWIWSDEYSSKCCSLWYEAEMSHIAKIHSMTDTSLEIQCQ